MSLSSLLFYTYVMAESSSSVASLLQEWQKQRHHKKWARKGRTICIHCLCIYILSKEGCGRNGRQVVPYVKCYYNLAYCRTIFCYFLLDSASFNWKRSLRPADSFCENNFFMSIQLHTIVWSQTNTQIH